MTTAELKQILTEAQRQHLRAVENWAGQQGKCRGVPVVQALTYELIQYINQAYLAALPEERLESDG